jgi:hypothetical protein
LQVGISCVHVDEQCTHSIIVDRERRRKWKVEYPTNTIIPIQCPHCVAIATPLPSGKDYSGDL